MMPIEPRSHASTTFLFRSTLAAVFIRVSPRRER